MKNYANKCKPVAVTHYPTKFNHFGLVFCHLPRYAYLDIVDLHPSEVKPMQTFFVLVPAFKDSQGKYMPPKLMLDDQTTNNTVVAGDDLAPSSPHSSSSVDDDQLKMASPSPSPTPDTSPVPAVLQPATNLTKTSKLHVLTPSNGVIQAKEVPAPVTHTRKVLFQKSLASKPPVSSSRSKSQPTITQNSSWPQVATQPRQPWSELSKPADLDIGVDAFPPLGKSSKPSPNKTVASSGRKEDDVSKMNRQFKVMRLTQLPADTLLPESDLSPVEA
jgi:hypothetical protein